jgi:hypothetical protein
MKSHPNYKNYALVMVTCMALLLVIFVIIGKDKTITWLDDYNLTLVRIGNAGCLWNLVDR